ncbi:MAG: hypothetical protein RXS23_08660 [Metallosphaera yellowstonensis]|jgi:hypothetical protein
MPNEVRIYLEVRKSKPDTDKILRLGTRNVYISGSQAIFQFVIIPITAMLTV